MHKIMFLINAMHVYQSCKLPVWGKYAFLPPFPLKYNYSIIYI